MSYVAQHVKLRNIVLSPNKQTTYGTALAVGNLTRRLRADPAAFAMISREHWSDIDRAGKGHTWPTLRELIGKDVRFTLSGEIDDFLAGWLLSFTLMKVVTTGTTPKTHTCTFEPTSKIAPVTTIYCEDGSAVKTKYPDLAVVSLKLSGGARGPLMYSVELQGSGNFTDGSITPAALPAAPIYLMANDTDILLGAPSSAASIKERVRSWELNFSTGLEQHRAPGGGDVSTFAKIGLQRVTGSVRVAAKDTDDLRSVFVADTLQELQINTNSHANGQMNLKFPNLYIRATPAADGEEQVWDLTFGEQDVMKGSALELFEGVAINTEATYLVGA